MKYFFVSVLCVYFKAWHSISTRFIDFLHHTGRRHVACTHLRMDFGEGAKVWLQWCNSEACTLLEGPARSYWEPRLTVQIIMHAACIVGWVNLEHELPSVPVCRSLLKICHPFLKEVERNARAKSASNLRWHYVQSIVKPSRSKYQSKDEPMWKFFTWVHSWFVK